MIFGNMLRKMLIFASFRNIQPNNSMQSIKKILVAIALIMAVAVPASAQFRFGIKAGATVNKLSLDKEVLKTLSSDNRTGFTGGIMAEFTVPIVGIGMDASVLYANRSFDIASSTETEIGVEHKTRSYIDIPLNLKYKLGLPGVGKIVTPFITTGPDFSFLCSKKNFENSIKNKSFDFAWNFGLGVQLFNHLQVAANYGLGISNSVSGNDAMYDSKNRTWTVTAAWLF